MKRLLCIVGGMNAGGAETFLMKMYRALDKNKYQMDFAVATDGIYDKEIMNLGGLIFKITPKSYGALKNFNDIRKIVSKNHYKAVLRVSQNSLSALELFAAQLGGAKIRGYRSSNSSTVGGTTKEIAVHKLCMWMPRLFANVRFAPSTEAAEYMFGKGCIQTGVASLLHNGLDTDVYRFSEDDRKEIRRQFGLDDSFVIGHVGRFNQQKNHGFLIECFEELKRRKDNAKLILCGTGEKEKEIQDKVEKLGLKDSVLFLGVRSDVPRILSAMDVFVFPSLYEGMPNTVIEAQSTGLPCVISDSVTKEAAITDLVAYCGLEETVDKWVDTILRLEGEKINRESAYQDLYRSGYDLNSCVKMFTKTVFGG